MSCQRPSDNAPRFPEDSKDNEPVGVLVDPLIVGDKPKDKNEKLRFYPTRVQERDRKINYAGFVPDCPKETTYQEDFTYRGKDLRRCKSYEFRANGEKCTFSLCIARPTSPFYGHRVTDLTPTVPKPKPYLIDEHAPIHCSEYTRTYSKLGRQILSNNLFVREAARFEDKVAKMRMWKGGA